MLGLGGDFPPSLRIVISFQVMAWISVAGISFKRHLFSAQFCQMQKNEQVEGGFFSLLLDKGMLC